MKLFQKITAMAAIMLVLLTACGQTSVVEPKVEGRLEPYVRAAQNADEVYLEVRADETMGTDLAKIAQKDGRILLDLIDRFIALVPTEQTLAQLRASSRYKVDGYGTFYAEIAGSGENNTAYCFEGEKLKYIVQTRGTTVSVYEPTLKTDFPEVVTSLWESFDAFSAAS